VSTGKHVVIVGAGGNIGSHLVGHVARMTEAGRVTIVDPDVYEAKNLVSQDISPCDVGARKVTVQARRLRTLSERRLRVVAVANRVEHVPAGRLVADVIVACLDSRASRQHVNQVAWRLGVPWIDAGVEPSQLLARVNVYVPALDTACLECAWSDADYAALEQSYPCAGDVAAPAATAGPSALGALAAALQAIECQKLLRGLTAQAAIGRQVLIDAASHRHFVTSYRRNSACRLHPHRPLDIEHVRETPSGLTLDAIFTRAVRDGCGSGPALSVEGRRFAERFVPAGSQDARGFDLRPAIERRHASPAQLARTLRRLGVRNGELITIVGEAARRDYLFTGDTV
jgi:molybdopterin/thiamine biosynthesis adenylyltransferase